MRADVNGDFWLVVGCIVVGGLLLTGCTSDPNETLVGTIADPAPKTTRYSTEKAAVDAAFDAVIDKYNEDLKNGHNWEHTCTVYEYEGGYYLTQVNADYGYKSVFYVEHNNAVAYVHTHPYGGHDIFSPDDLVTAKHYGVDAYAAVVGSNPYFSHDKFYMSQDASSHLVYSEYYTYDELTEFSNSVYSCGQRNKQYSYSI